GCARVGEEKFGLLNLCTDEHICPKEITKCLKELGRIHGKSLEIQSFRTRSDMGEGDLQQQEFWQQWAREGVRTILVMMPYSPEKQRVRSGALRAGIATQFFTPKDLNQYKAFNIVLGLLCKAKWQPIHLQPHSEWAELIIGFDAGTNRSLYFGTPAFAILANGQSLGWELPSVQRGEKISGEALWQTVCKLVGKFKQYHSEKRYPKKVLLLRDGLARQDEFQRTIDELGKMNIAVDLLSVRKTGAGRLAQKIENDPQKIENDPQKIENDQYAAAPKGTVVFEEQERSFILISSQPIKSRGKELGSARPLRVVHEYGKTSLEQLAIQTYHLTQLHPGSAFSHARLPWVLHLAHRLSQEFSRLPSLDLVATLDRDKLIGV
uniref:Piwi domain-containing protein n=1 Tax=uncultured Thermosynechococcus sp. TaxID=436945 RepID=UPI00261894AF